MQVDLFDDVVPGMMDISEEDTPELSLDNIQFDAKDKPSKNLFWISVSFLHIHEENEKEVLCGKEAV